MLHDPTCDITCISLKIQDDRQLVCLLLNSCKINIRIEVLDIDYTINIIFISRQVKSALSVKKCNQVIADLI